MLKKSRQLESVVERQFFTDLNIANRNNFHASFPRIPNRLTIFIASVIDVACRIFLLNFEKAREVSLLPRAQGKAVLGADTVVVFNGEVLGKPKDEGDAVRMLTALSGNTHEVYTGVCMLYPTKAGLRTFVDADCTKVTFYPLTESFIRDYVAGGSPMDKAGAYGIQDGGLVEKIDGSFTNVVGLPQELCKKLLDMFAAYERLQAQE